MPKLIQPRVFHPGRTARVVAVVLALMVWAGVREHRRRDGAVWGWSGEAFGSTYTVKVWPAPPAADRERIGNGLEGVIRRVDETFSTYGRDSELARLNAAATTNVVAVSPLLARLLTLSQAVSAASDGAFDITCGPVLRCWKFDEGGGELKPPDAAAVADAAARSGHAFLHLEGGSLRRDRAGREINVNAVAPGLAADLLREWLAGQGMTNVFIEVGGETLATGAKAGGQPWRIGIQRPELEAAVGGRPELIVELRDRALATSGDYRHYRRDAAGRIVSHIFDPRKGRPMVADWASVSVIAPTCGEADAWSTAMFVLGPEEGFRILAARAPGLEAMFLIRDGQGFKKIKTPGFIAEEPKD